MPEFVEGYFLNRLSKARRASSGRTGPLVEVSFSTMTLIE